MGVTLPSESYGRYLQAIRLEKNISLEEVAAQTRIGPRILKAIEHEDAHRLPVEVFLKGFLRAYAAAVGAEGDEAVRRYEAQRELIRKTQGSGVESRRSRLGSNGELFIALVLLAALVAGSIAAWQFAIRPTPEPLPAVAFTASHPMGVELGAGGQADQTVAAAPGPGAAAAGLELTITAQESTWVKVVTDQGTPGQYTLRAGQQLRLEARSHFNLLIGNAGAVLLTLNNTPVAVPGKRGEPVNLHLP